MSGKVPAGLTVRQQLDSKYGFLKVHIMSGKVPAGLTVRQQLDTQAVGFLKVDIM